MSDRGPIHQLRDSPQCPTCYKRNMDKRTLKEGYYCRNCGKLIPMEQIRWPSQRPKVAGSGQYAGPVYRRNYANWGGRRRSA